MLHGFSGLGQETAQPGWAQMADCMAAGGQWTGTECIQGQASVPERACVAAGGIWNAATSQCSVPIVTPGVPPQQPPPKEGISTMGMVGLAAVGAIATAFYLRRPKRPGKR